MKKTPISDLKATGERMMPSHCHSSTFWEHISRYRFAAQHAMGLDVLDIACGEGYGTAALKVAGAKSVLGVDISQEAAAHAAERYGVNTRQGSATSIPCADNSFDLVVSFETIEHVQQPERFLDEVCRVLRPGGSFIVSTPNKEVYHEVDPSNSYHISELSLDEFTGLLGARFPQLDLRYQSPRSSKLISFSVLAAEKSPISKIRGYHRGIRFLRSWFCPHLIDGDLLASARLDPVHAVMSHGVTKHGWLNPFALRGPIGAWGTRSTYVVAICRR